MISLSADTIERLVRDGRTSRSGWTEIVAPKGCARDRDGGSVPLVAAQTSRHGHDTDPEEDGENDAS